MSKQAVVRDFKYPEPDLDNASILVTGGTGSFGKGFIKTILKRYRPRKTIVFSRDELKQSDMSQDFPGAENPSIRFFIGDVRDKDRLCRALDGIDYVVHAAAAKIVETAEYDPFECVKTNVIGAMNLIDACIDKRVKRIVTLSTDKASSPANLYGATKLTSDRLFVSGNSYSGSHETRCSVVRYGNVMGSRGSVIPFFLSIAKDGVFPITDNRMTRFMILLEEGVELVWHAFNDMKGGEIYIKKIPSMKVTDIATGKIVHNFEGHTHHALGVSWLPHGRQLVSVGADKSIRHWNFEAGERIRQRTNIGKEVTSIHFVGLTEQAVVTAGDKSVRLINISNLNDARSYSGGGDFMYTCVATPDAKIIVAGGQDSALRIWNLADGKAIATFEAPKPPVKGTKQEKK